MTTTPLIVKMFYLNRRREQRLWIFREDPSQPANSSATLAIDPPVTLCADPRAEARQRGESGVAHNGWSEVEYFEEGGQEVKECLVCHEDIRANPDPDPERPNSWLHFGTPGFKHDERPYAVTQPTDMCLNPILTPRATGADRQNCGRCRYRVKVVGPDVHHMRVSHTTEVYR